MHTNMDHDHATDDTRQVEHSLRSRIRRHPWMAGVVVCGLIAIPGAIIAVQSKQPASSTTASVASVRSTSPHAAEMYAPYGNSSSGATSSTSQAASSIASPVAVVNGASAGSNATAGKGASAKHAGHEVIEKASISLESSHLSATTSKLTQMVNNVGGFISSMQDKRLSGQSQDQATETIHMVLRVPESSFATFVRGTRGLGHVNSFNETGQDVTQQHNDVAIQIDELNRERTAYMRLFNKASSMKDMLQIQQSIAQADNQLSLLRGQLNHLDQAVQLSTVDVTMTPQPIATAPTSAFKAALLKSVHFMATSARGLLIFLAWVLPWAALVACVGFIWRKWSRHKGREGMPGSK